PGLTEMAHPRKEKGSKLRIKDRVYAHGIGTVCPGETLIDLSGAFSVFTSDLGFIKGHPDISASGAIVRIYVDDRKCYESDLMREGDAARHVRIPVKGAQELRLEVHALGDSYIPGRALFWPISYVNWGDAALERDPAAVVQSRMEQIDVAPFARVT